MTRTFLWLLVAFHFFVIVVNLTAFFLLPFTWLITGLPFWYTVFLIMPIESFILTIVFSKTPCPLTVMENWLRKKLGMREIGGFISYYIVRQKWRQ